MGLDDLSPEDRQKLKEEVADELLRDGRRKTQAPPGVEVGSPEYWKWWRERNKEKQKLYNKKSYLRRRKIMLAMQEHDASVPEQTTEEAVKAVDEELAELRSLRRESFTDLRQGPTKAEEAEPPIPFVVEEAQKHGVTYTEALMIMDRSDYGARTFGDILQELKSTASKGETSEGGVD